MYIKKQTIDPWNKIESPVIEPGYMLTDIQQQLAHRMGKR